MAGRAGMIGVSIVDAKPEPPRVGVRAIHSRIFERNGGRASEILEADYTLAGGAAACEKRRSAGANPADLSWCNDGTGTHGYQWIDIPRIPCRR